MLSRLALQKVAALWRPRVIQSASYWSASSMGHLDQPREDMKTLIERWDKANKMFNSPDRDFKNFPVLRAPDDSPAVRLVVFPKTWFDAFYEKTGVTGPYMLFTGGLIFMFSKEYLIVEHKFMEAIAMMGAIAVFYRLFNKSVSEYLNKEARQSAEKYWYEPIWETIVDAQSAIDKINASLESQGLTKFIHDVKRENVDLQLEAAYRQRLVEVHQAVKKRLDYQVDRENAVKRFEHSHMVNWIIQNVMKSITPQQEKETLARCIQDLKALSATAKV